MDLNSCEFYLSDGSGDEYLEVLNDEDETIRAGEAIQIGRGERARVRFNALHMNSREYAEYGKLYAWSGIVQVDEDGCLVLPNGKKHQADGSCIEIYPQNGNCLRFGRAADCTNLEALLNREHERPRAALPSERLDFEPNEEQSVGITIETSDVLDRIRQRLREGVAPSRAEQGAAVDPTRARSPVQWRESLFNPTARISDDIRADIAAMPLDQHGEFVVEGDDWIELHGSNGHRAEGRAVLADRGDRLEIHFGTWGVLGWINPQGQLVISGAAVAETHEPGPGAILCFSEFASLRFQRVTDLLSEASSLPTDKETDVRGTEVFDRGAFKWEFSFDAPQLVAFLEVHLGSDAMWCLRHELQGAISQAIAQAVGSVARSDLDRYEMFRVPALARAGTGGSSERQEEEAIGSVSSSA